MYHNKYKAYIVTLCSVNGGIHKIDFTTRVEGEKQERPLEVTGSF